MHVPVTIYADFICPWCFIGERKLSLAAEQAPDLSLRITYRPFELNPGTPLGGWLRRDYRIAKFGSWTRSQMLDAQVAAAAAEVGLHFNYDQVTRTPNTALAHRLMWAAQTDGADSQALAHLLFTAYFTDGEDISDFATLRRIAPLAGLSPERTEAVLTGADGAAELREAMESARDLGIGGVPFFIIGDRAVEGAQPVPVLAAALREAAGHTAAAA